MKEGKMEKKTGIRQVGKRRRKERKKRRETVE